MTDINLLFKKTAQELPDAVLKVAIKEYEDGNLVGRSKWYPFLIRERARRISINTDNDKMRRSMDEASFELYQQEEE